MNTESHPIFALIAEWPTDLLIDYILKIHHRGIRLQGPVLTDTFRSLLAPSSSLSASQQELLSAVFSLVSESLSDLDMHLMKEENVLFPYLLELCQADQQRRPIAPMHCGSVSNPIGVMNMEHDGELHRYARIAELTHHFAPIGNEAYDRLMHRLRAFMEALHEHIELEDAHLFPRALRLEADWVR